MLLTDQKMEPAQEIVYGTQDENHIVMNEKVVSTHTCVINGPPL